MGDLGMNTRVIQVEQLQSLPIWESLDKGRGRVALWLKLGSSNASWQLVRFDITPDTKFHQVAALSSEITLTLGNVGLQVESESLVAIGKLHENQQHWGLAILLANPTSPTGFLRENLPKRGNPYDVLRRHLGC